MKICFRGARNLTSCRCIFTETQMHFFWATSDSIWNVATCLVHVWILWAVLLANDLDCTSPSICHETAWVSRIPTIKLSMFKHMSNTWRPHTPNIVLQMFLGAEMALQTLCGPWLCGPSCSSQAHRKVFDLVWSILKHFPEWERTWSGYQFGIYWYFNSVTTHTNMLSRTPRLISGIQLTMPLRQDSVSKSWVWCKWSVYCGRSCFRISSQMNLSQLGFRPTNNGCQESASSQVHKKLSGCHVFEMTIGVTRIKASPSGVAPMYEK